MKFIWNVFMNVPLTVQALRSKDIITKEQEEEEETTGFQDERT